MSYTTQEYIEAYKRGDISDLEELPNLIEAYVYQVCHKFTNLAPLEDLYQMAWEGILRAIPRYDSSKGKSFLNYITSAINYRLCGYNRELNFNTNKINNDLVSLDNLIFTDDRDARFVDTIQDVNIDLEYDILVRESYNSVLRYIKSLPDDEKSIMLLYLEEYKSQEIANMLDLDYKYVVKIVKKQIRYIRLDSNIVHI